jgi:hypothetical protein
VYTDFSKAFDRVTHFLLCFELMKSFSGMMLARFWSYLIGRTQYVRLDDFLSDVTYCHSGVPQVIHLGSLFFINNVAEMFRIFQYVSTLGYVDELEHVEEIKDLGFILDTRISFLSHVETIIFTSARILSLIKHISMEFNDHYTDKALFGIKSGVRG